MYLYKVNENIDIRMFLGDFKNIYYEKKLLCMNCIILEYELYKVLKNY